jgi:hypothetical protein
MQIRCPELTSELVAEWLQRDVLRPAASKASSGVVVQRMTPYHHPGFDFKKAREALNRARNKTEVRTLKPLQRLRRNQGAVNEGLIDAFSALIAVNKQMAREIAAVSSETAVLRQRLAEYEAQSMSQADSGTR